MKVKTSVSLSSEILEQVSQFAPGGERSEFIEKALRKYLDFLRRQERTKLDLERINKASSYLNNEASDSLDFQVSL